MTMQIFDTPEQINTYKLLVLRSALKAEIVGLKIGRINASVIVRELLGSKTKDKSKLLEEFNSRYPDLPATQS